LSLGYMDRVKKIGPGNLPPALANRREGLLPPSPEPPTQQKKKEKIFHSWSFFMIENTYK
ncbi:hypothetical protein, partial [Chryseobacterium oncorhynchi]|uniref:hypothetical protein n=1 Tax=Chryseobacterium oncorhynchi TaxID=741074 RepID=UPI001E4CCEF9